MNNLRKILQEKGLKQAAVARELGVSKQTVCFWVNKKCFPKRRNLKDLMELLDIEKKELIS